MLVELARYKWTSRDARAREKEKERERKGASAESSRCVARLLLKRPAARKFAATMARLTERSQLSNIEVFPYPSIDNRHRWSVESDVAAASHSRRADTRNAHGDDA